MKYLVNGAGQIGTQLVKDLLADGHDVHVLRASNAPVSGATVFSGDVADRALLQKASQDCAAIFHCTHAPYDSRIWRELLPGQERAVMDCAAELEIPVVFPESMYAFAGKANPVEEGDPPSPIEGKGEVRAELLAAREEHEATAISIVAADLYGPTATSQGSVLKATVLDPRAKGRPVIVMADPEVKHSFTYIPDLTRAMRRVAAGVDKAVLHAPTAPAGTIRDWAEGARVWSVPPAALRFAGRFHRTAYELAAIESMWYEDCVLGPSSLEVN